MQLVSIPANPAPENVVVGTLQAADGVSLRYARWSPPAGRKGTVCLLQGRGEFIEKYYETVADLRARGFAVATFDWRGQGLSHRLLPDRLKGHVSDFSEYDIDLETFMREVVLPDCPPPIFGLGHSMGGAVLIRAARQGHRWFDRIVLSAPMIALRGADGRGIARTTVKIMRLFGLGSSYIPGGDRAPVGTRPFVGNILTSDPLRYARNAAVLEAEPAVGLAAPTVAWADSAFKVMGEFSQSSYGARIRQPILIVATGRDELVSTPAIEEFGMRLRAGAHLIVAGAEHEILMEQDRYRGQFWAAFDAFVPGTPVFGSP
jgi:lysophospholipase